MEPIRCEQAALTAERPHPDVPCAANPGASGRERRLQLRAYNHWASLLSGRRVPAVADLCRGGMLDFSGHSLLLDLDTPSGKPTIAYFGDRLAIECGADPIDLHALRDASAGSLLSRLAERCQEVVASRSPAGFEAEIASADGLQRLYRGILLPFSGGDAAVDHVLAVVNWKEEPGEPAAHRPIAPGAPGPGQRPLPTAAIPPTFWADGPGCDLAAPPCPPAAGLPDAVAEHLRALPLRPFIALAAEGCEFALALVRRPAAGPAQLLGEVPHDAVLLEEAARRFLG